MQEAYSQATNSTSTLALLKPGMNTLVTSKEQILSNYPDVFEGIGRFPGHPYHIQFNSNTTPKQTPCRLVPVHLKETFKKAMVKMLKAGIIKPVKKLLPG